MADNPSSRTALVTGASSGIGMATARTLATLGFDVYAAARRVDRMKDLKAQGISPISMDVTDDSTMTVGVERIVSETGRIDVLVNNAGYGSYGAVEDVPLDEGRRQFDVNVFGMARLTQLVLPQMRERGSGRIINVSSIGGKVGMPMGAWYHATKFAVEGLSDALRQEVAPFGIKVVVIEPGAIDTEWGGIAMDSLAERSGDGAYADQVAKLSQMFESQAGGMSRSKPDVVAKAIGTAANSAHPRLRYAVGLGAKPLTYARRLLPDPVFDRALKLSLSAMSRGS